MFLCSSSTCCTCKSMHCPRQHCVSNLAFLRLDHFMDWCEAPQAESISVDATSNWCFSLQLILGLTEIETQVLEAILVQGFLEKLLHVSDLLQCKAWYMVCPSPGGRKLYLENWCSMVCTSILDQKTQGNTAQDEITEARKREQERHQGVQVQLQADFEARFFQKEL